MNQGAREALGSPATILEALRARARLPAMECFGLGVQRLWLGTLPHQQRLDCLRQLNRQLWGFYCRRDTRNLDLTRAGGRLETHQRHTSRERFLRRAGLDFLQAIESERGRIARELHDNAGQSLAGILLNLDLVERQLGSSQTEVLARLRRSRELASLTLDQVRRISHELHPPEWQDQDFSQAVEWMIDRMDLRSRLEIEIVQLDVPRNAPPALLTVLYRTLQEGFTNILRHAEATRVFIDVSTSSRGVTLLLEDNGRGFDPAALGAAGHGIGLVNLRRRLASLGGRLEIDSSPGAGARVSAFVPARLIPPE
jgi:signal transduction histidine kinase